MDYICQWAVLVANLIFAMWRANWPCSTGLGAPCALHREGGEWGGGRKQLEV